VAPDRIFMAERAGGRGWRELSYAELLAASRHIASALLMRGLSTERPVVILSGNAIDHALIAFGALYAGIPFCPVSPAYSLVSRDYGKLAYLMKLLTPGLVFADDAEKFAGALAANVPEDTEIAAAFGKVADRNVTTLADLMATPLHPDLDAIHDAIGPDSIAKFLLTSGSTGNPKAVINTQRMICANQVMIRETMAFLKDEPPVIVDWLPWNHTFGGNHNIGLTLYNGGSMYLDQGKPMPGGIEETVRNLREISPTVYFNVPKGYESLLPYLRDDAALRAKFFSRLHAMFFSGAALAPHIWSGLDELSVSETGARVPMLTGLGATETAPFFMAVNPRTSRSGHVGLPVPGNDAKLVPNNGKLEVRAKGPNVTPGYWRQPDLTKAAFDEEGFYKFGDALKPADPGDLDAGFDFDGRIAEDFKLASGTWVSVGPLRARFIAACAPLVRDVVIAGLNRDEISALVLLDLDGCRLINAELPLDDIAATAADPLVREAFRERFEKFLGASTGSSTRIARAILLDTPLSIDRGEVTDKGSINQRAVLEHRSQLVDALYSRAPPLNVITPSQS
jgi:feruloyl-CoA synthase